MPSKAGSKDEAPIEGVLQMLGDDHPTSKTHRCPYQPNGADEKICSELTSNYQRNKAGCCGTSDHRAFPPCNSVRRKCVDCLADGMRERANTVCDPKTGLCEEHKELAQKTVLRPQVQVQRHVPRLALRAEPTYRPTAPKPPVAQPSVVAKPLPDEKPVFKSPAKPSPTVKKVSAQVPKGAEVKKAAVVEQALAAPVKSPELPVFDFEAGVQKMSKLSKREMEVVVAVLENKELAGITKASLAAWVSGICTRLGIPTTNRHEAYDRRGALRQIFIRHSSFQSEGKVESKTQEPQEPKTIRTNIGSSGKEEEEQALLARFRKLRDEDRALVLTYVRSFDGRQ